MFYLTHDNLISLTASNKLSSYVQQSSKQMLDLKVNLNFPPSVSPWVNSLGPIFFSFEVAPSSFSMNLMGFLHFSLHINDYNTFEEISHHVDKCAKAFWVEVIKERYSK